MSQKIINNIFLIGGMGVGKTTTGRKLAARLNYQFYDTDQELEKIAGVDISWIFDLEGEQGFRKRETKLIAELTQKQGIVLATGGGSAIDEQTKQHLIERGIVIYLKTSIKCQLERLRQDKRRPLLKKPGDRTQILEELLEKREPYYSAIADYTFNTESKSIGEIVQEIMNIAILSR